MEKESYIDEVSSIDRGEINNTITKALLISQTEKADCNHTVNCEQDIVLRHV